MAIMRKFLKILATSNQNKKGFSVFELAVLMGIFSVMLLTVLQIYKQYSKQVVYNNTMTRRVNAEAALGRFYALHNRLPCPSDNSLPADNRMAGVEQCSEALGYNGPLPRFPTLSDADCGTEGEPGICRINGARRAPRDINGNGDDIAIGTSADGLDTVLRGGLPYVTLGMSPIEERDGYGNRMTYAVTEFHTRNALLPIDPLNPTAPRPPVNLLIGTGTNAIDFRAYGGAIAVTTWQEGVVNATNASSLTFNPTRDYQPDQATDESGATVNFLRYTRPGAPRAMIVQAIRGDGLTGGYVHMENAAARVANPAATGNPTKNTGVAGGFDMVLLSHGPDGKGAYTPSGRLFSPCPTDLSGADNTNCNMGLSTFVAANFISTNRQSASYFDDLFVSTTKADQNDRWQLSDAADSIRTAETSIAIGKAVSSRVTQYNANGQALGAKTLSMDVAGTALATRQVDAGYFRASNSQARGFMPERSVGSDTGLRCGSSDGFAVLSGLAPIANGKGDVKTAAPECANRLIMDGEIKMGDCQNDFGTEFKDLVGFTPKGNRLCSNRNGQRNDAECTDTNGTAYAFHEGVCAADGQRICANRPGSVDKIPPRCYDTECFSKFGKTYPYSTSALQCADVMDQNTVEVKRCTNEAGDKIVSLNNATIAAVPAPGVGVTKVTYASGTEFNACPAPPVTKDVLCYRVFKNTYPKSAPHLVCSANTWDSVNVFRCTNEAENIVPVAYRDVPILSIVQGTSVKVCPGNSGSPPPEEDPEFGGGGPDDSVGDIQGYVEERRR